MTDSTQIHRQIVERLGDAILLADRAGHIQLWNDACTRVFGWSAEEAVGRSLDLIIPERQRARHWEAYHSAVQRDTYKYGPGDLLAVPAMRKSGDRISVEFTVAPLKAANGTTIGIVACLRDVTAKREEALSLRARIAELERDA